MDALKCAFWEKAIYRASKRAYIGASDRGVYAGQQKGAKKRVYTGQEECRMLWHICRCGAMIPQNMRLCSACEQGQNSQYSRHMQYNRTRRNKQAADFYVCADWRNIRAVCMRLYDGLDIYAYYVQHRVVTADMVHHVTELDEDWSRRLDISNLLPLSNSNHGIISALYDKDEETKRATQQMLYGLIAEHWKAAGGIEKVIVGLI